MPKHNKPLSFPLTFHLDYHAFTHTLPSHHIAGYVGGPTMAMIAKSKFYSYQKRQAQAVVLKKRGNGSTGDDLFAFRSPACKHLSNR